MKTKIAMIGLMLVMQACGARPASAPAPTMVPATKAAISPTEAASPTVAEATLTPVPTETPSPWLAAPVIPAPQFISLKMISALEGWAIAAQAVLRTQDGGQTWHDVSMPGVSNLVSGTGFSALDENTAWVLVTDPNAPLDAGTLYRTADGGLTWETIPVAFGGGSLEFVDESVGWVMSSLGVGAGSMAVAIFRSADGGLTWNQVYTNDPNLPEAGDSLPLGGLKNNLTAKDAQTAWVAGVIYAPDTIYLYKSDDGGQTWASQSLPPATGIPNFDASTPGLILLNASEAVLPVQFYGDNQQTGFYRSDDGGDTWAFAALLSGTGFLDFGSPMDGFFWNGQALYVSTDGGVSWIPQQPNINFGDRVMLMDFADAQHGWIVTYEDNGQRFLYTTEDGGKTWEQLAP